MLGQYCYYYLGLSIISKFSSIFSERPLFSNIFAFGLLIISYFKSDPDSSSSFFLVVCVVCTIIVSSVVSWSYWFFAMQCDMEDPQELYPNNSETCSSWPLSPKLCPSPELGTLPSTLRTRLNLPSQSSSKSSQIHHSIHRRRSISSIGAVLSDPITSTLPLHTLKSSAPFAAQATSTRYRVCSVR